MPVSSAFADGNRTQTERLRRIVQRLAPAMFSVRVAAAAVQAAEEVDAFLLQVPDEVVEVALARPDKPNLDRGSHREGHLDQIEQALAKAGDA